MRLLEKIKTLPKRKLVIGLVILITTVLVIGIFIWATLTGKIKFLAATNPSQVSNQATVTFKDAAGQTHTVQSNTVTTDITTPTGIVDLSANPATINSGDPSTLTWTITTFTVSQCTATPSGWWTNSLTGTKAVSPTSTATYTLSCTDGTTPVSQSAVVTVTTKLGDINGDNNIDELDFTLLLYNWGDSPKNIKADINGDSRVDELDFTVLLYWWGK